MKLAHLAALAAILGHYSATKASDTPPNELLDAIRFVESGNNPNVADGDSGLAVGQFQIHYCYWKDATDFDTTIGGCYNDCRDEQYARRIVMAYWERYVPEALANGDYETLAKTHHELHWKRSQRSMKNAAKYWNKVKRKLYEH